jgi:RimJ/RimL family protein N-acetyltransferase
MADLSLRPVQLRDGELLLRPWEPADAGAVHLACQDPDIQRWTTVPVPYREEDAVGFVTGCATRWAEGTASFAVVEAASGMLLGSMGLDTTAGGGCAEVGFWVAPEARGRGVATRALRLLCHWAFDDLGLRRLEWQAYAGNVASLRTAAAVGFRFEGTRRLGLLDRGRPTDGWVAGLLASDLVATPGEAPSTAPARTPGPPGR